MTGLIGHRGGRNVWPENSLDGFRKLLDVPVEGVEFDVHLSDAGELLVIHDATLDRTTEGSGPSRVLTPEARATLRLRDSNEGVPVLSEVLEIYADSTLDLHVELKNDGEGKAYPGLPALVLAEIDRLGLRDRCCLTSFDLDVLRECRDLAPQMRRLCSVNDNSAQKLGVRETISAAAELADYVAVHKDMLSTHWDAITTLVPLSRLGAWVANTPEEINRWLEAGPGFITTDEPVLADRLRRARLDAGEAAQA